MNPFLTKTTCTIGLRFCSEDGGRSFLQHVCTHLSSYMTPYLRTQPT